MPPNPGWYSEASISQSRNIVHSVIILEGHFVHVVFADVGLPVVVVGCVVKDILPDLIYLAGIVSITSSVCPWLVDHLDLTYLPYQIGSVQLNHTLRNLYTEGFQGNLQFP